MQFSLISRAVGFVQANGVALTATPASQYNEPSPVSIDNRQTAPRSFAAKGLVMSLVKIIVITIIVILSILLFGRFFS